MSSGSGLEAAGREQDCEASERAWLGRQLEGRAVAPEAKDEW